jgi:hypothetical protein
MQATRNVGMKARALDPLDLFGNSRMCDLIERL